MRVDIVFDASYCPINKFGTYCFYVRQGDSFGFSSSGLLKKCSSPTEAELMALVNSLHALKKSVLSGKVTFITIHSDCMNIFGKVSSSTENEIGVKAFETIIEIMQRTEGFKRHKIFYKMQHVKAHTGKQDKISRLNEYCHNQAKIQLNLRRQEINEENHIFCEEDKTPREIPGDLSVDSRDRSNEQRLIQIPLRNPIKKRHNVSQKL
jgi:ribonuclease HI